MLPGKKAEIVLNQKVLKAFKQKAQQGTSNDSDSPLVSDLMFSNRLLKTHDGLQLGYG